MRHNLRKSGPEIAIRHGTMVPSDVYDTAAYDFHKLKFVKAKWFPCDVQALPHVMELIDLFSMPAETAAMEASATGQLDWLTTLFPRLED